jgi:hypothetical protein
VVTRRLDPRIDQASAKHFSGKMECQVKPGNDVPCNGRREDNLIIRHIVLMRQFPPRRIVCLTEETVERLYLLGEEDRIIVCFRLSFLPLVFALYLDSKWMARGFRY